MRSEGRALAALLVAATVIGAGAPAPSLRLAALDGSPVEVTRGSDRALVVHFWATWCPSCVVELPLLARSFEACDRAGVRLIAVSVGESADDVQRYAREHDLELSLLLLDPSGAAWRKAGFRELPANLVLKEAGARAHAGPRTAEEWRAELHGLGCSAASPDGE